MRISNYEDLTRALPHAINLQGFTEIHLEAVGLESLMSDDERASVITLEKALWASGIDPDTSSVHNRSLISEDNWTDYCRDIADDSMISADNPLTAFIDWDRYAASVRTDYTRIDVPDGEFAGSWWTRS